MPAPPLGAVSIYAAKFNKKSMCGGIFNFPPPGAFTRLTKKAGPGQMPKGPLEGVENHLYLSMTAFMSSQATSMSETSLNCVRQRSRFWPSRWVWK